MGMDLLLNFVWAAKDKEPDWDGAKSFLENLTLEQCMDHPEFEFHTGFGYDPNYPTTEQDKKDLEYGIASLKRRLLRCHDAIQKAWNNNYYDRSTFWLNIGKYKVLVSGGDSWGDSPSEMFDYMQDWANVNGLDKFGFYQE